MKQYFSLNSNFSSIIINGNLNDMGIIQNANDNITKIYGFNKKEIIKKNVKDFLMTEPIKKRHNQFIKNYIYTGESDLIN